MAFKDQLWNIIWTKTKIKKHKEIKDIYKIWKTFHYVWKTRDTWNRIVYFEWKILEKLEDDMFKVEFIDRHKDNSNTHFIKIVPKKVIHLK